MWGRIYPHVILLIFANIFKASCEGTSSLTFVIDDTASMTDDIDQVKSSVNKIMNIVFNEKSSLINNMVLVTVNDPDSQVRAVTKDRSTFKSAVDAVYAHNNINPDCWEPSMKGLLLALENSLPGSYLYVFTDATAKDHVDSALVIEMCQRTQSQITFVLTGRCWGSQRKVFHVFFDIAAACSGLAFYVKKDEVNEVLRTIEETIKGNKTVMATRTVPAGVYTDIPFTIDEHTDYAIVSASGSHVSLSIRGPFARQEKIMCNNNGKVIKLSDAIPGQYVATVMGHTTTSVVIVGRTDFLFSHGFSELTPKTLGDTSPQPIADANVHLSISVTDPKHSVKILSAQILQMDEKPMKELPLREMSKDFYITKPFVAPSQMFKVAVKGIVKATGKPITRIAKIPVTPQKPPKKLPNKTKPTASIVEGHLTEVEYDSTVKLTCKVTAYPKPKIMWINSKGTTMKSSDSVLQYPYEYISYMTLSNAMKGDKYMCYAVNDDGKDTKTINVIVKDPLVVYSAPEGTTKVAYGSEGIITCDIRSLVSMHILWYYANEITAENGQIVTSDKYWISPDGTQLKIKTMDIDLVGKYTCKASLINNKDVQKALSTRVKIDGLIAPKITGITAKKATNGTAAVLECKIINGLPKPKVTWQFMDKTGSKFTPIGGSENVLRISSVEDKHAGRYKCVAENVAGRDEHVTTFIIQYLPKITSKPSMVFKSIEGDAHLRIPCVSTGLPKPVITWKLNGRAITPNTKYSTEDGALIIRDPKVSDTNAYTCEARNAVGSVSATFQTHIFQIPKVSGVATKKVRIGTSAIMECMVVKGEPKPKITWQFMDSFGSKFIPIGGSDNVLRIPSVEIKHAGRYKCVAQNNVGNDEHITTLLVQDLPKITSNVSTVYQSTEGDALLRIPCVATGIPKPTTTWKLNGLAITPNAKYSIEDGTLTIRDPKVSDTNAYTCEAKNEAGSVSATFQTHILQTPKVSGVDAKTVKMGTSAILECMVLKGEPKPKITWQFMDKSASMFAPIAGSDNTLRISSAENKHAGRYKCVAQNNVGSDEHVTTLIVESLPTIITNSTVVFEGLEGDMALRIPCDVIGVPKPVVSWKSKGAAITPNTKYSIEDGALVIMNPNVKDSTSYTCEATNYIGSVSATFQANIEKFLDNLGIKHHVYLLEGETRKLECQAYNSKSQSVRWFIGGVEKKIDKPHLQVVKASVREDGNYTCRVTDKHGYTHTHTYVVDVGHAPMLYDQNPVNDWRGDITDIVSNCESDAKPPADIEWNFNGKVLTDRNLADIGILYKWGHYVCNISNVHGSVQRSFDVKSSACLINRNLRDAEHMPLLLTDELTWPKWETTKHFSVVEQEKKITLSCPHRKDSPINAFQKFPKQSELKAFCNQQDMFLVDGKFYKLSDLQCSNSIQPSIARKKVKCLTDTSELIRVGYNVAGFLESYEVCFDYAKNMPLYTRVLMTPTDGSLNAAHNWYKYPGIGDGKRDTGFTCENSLSSCCYGKSQLVNARDFNYGPAKYSTFIDHLNAIPSLRPCKNTSKTTWEDIDDMVRSQLTSYNEFVAWSGTHTLQEKNGAVIPRFLWKVLRFDEDESIAIVHVNDPSPTDKDIKCENICIKDEISWFKASDKYTYCCKLSDFLEAFDFRGTDIGESLDVALRKIEKST